MLSSKILKQINKVVDSDGFLNMAQSSAKGAHKSFKGEKGSSQIRNLQNIVNSTARFSEISNFIKSQTGRHREWQTLGPKMIEDLEQIDKDAREIVKTDDKDNDLGEVRLRLSRHWVKIVVAEFLYSEIEGKVSCKN